MCIINVLATAVERVPSPLVHKQTWESYKKCLREFLQVQIQDHIRQDTMGTFERYTNLRVLLGQVNRKERRCGYKLLQEESECGNRIDPEKLFETGDWNDHSDPRVILMRGRAGIGKTSFVRKLVYEWAREELDFRLNPPDSAMDGAGVYVGQYGPRKISLEGGKLTYQRGEGQKMTLTPMSRANLFHVGDLDYFRIQFIRDANGDVTGLVGQYNDGRTDQNDKQDR